MPTIAATETTITPMDWKQTDLYRFFALIFAPPKHECFTFLAQPAAAMALRDLWTRLELEGEFPGFAWDQSRGIKFRFARYSPRLCKLATHQADDRLSSKGPSMHRELVTHYSRRQTRL
jgi:hypothetical protein